MRGVSERSGRGVWVRGEGEGRRSRGKKWVYSDVKSDLCMRWEWEISSKLCLAYPACIF